MRVFRVARARRIARKVRGVEGMQAKLVGRDEEMAKRRKAWTAPAFKATRGTLYKYIKNVKSASEGCVTDE